MAKYFTFYELIDSKTAKEYGITNMPNSLEIYRNLDNLMCNLLDPLREAIGQPIYVNSGYRSGVLNNIVHGVIGSQHTKGEAADIRCKSRTDTLKLWNLLRDGRFRYDQAILYTKRNFIHVSLVRDRRNRQEFFYNTE